MGRLIRDRGFDLFLDGFVVGGVSAMYAPLGGGIILQAVSLTLLVLFIMLVIQKTGIIPVTQTGLESAIIFPLNGRRFRRARGKRNRRSPLL